jgi:hypothetical protein
MKPLTFTVFAILVLACPGYAKIWRVNNNAGINADFTTLQAGHDGASAGDTLHMEGSPVSYGGATFTKKLVVIGPGYFLDQSTPTQALKQTAIVGGITLYAASAGSVIMGLDFNASGITVYAHNIVIRRNKFSSPNGTTPDYSTGYVNVYYSNQGSNPPVQNTIISQNYGLLISVNYPSTGILISNNYIAYHAYAGDATAGESLRLHANAIAIIQNNVLRRGKITVSNTNLTNNIMVAGSLQGTDNLIANNLGNGTQFGTADGNKSNVDMNSVFLGSGSGVSFDGQWKLAVGSPAIGVGYGSTVDKPVDAGIFSGQTPYVLAGLPPVPSIYYFENKPIGSNTDPITVTVKVKSNN